MCLFSPDDINRLPDGDVTNAPDAYAHDFSGYHQGARPEVISLVPTNATKILDVGGGEGGFLRALKALRDCETHLAEYSPTACQAAVAHVDRIWEGDFLSHDFGDEKFDCITFLDVLEHTETPENWLLHASRVLAEDGSIIASIPNVGHWSVIADLLEGRWDYAPAGIHCVTHLRFFTRHGIEALFKRSGLHITAITPTTIAPPDWFVRGTLETRLGKPVSGDISAVNFLVTAKRA
jgi:2-polyprenyl-3-methyl-5-hydroxy-6-metoxy-1,4-benzoquinol methylase